MDVMSGTWAEGCDKYVEPKGYTGLKCTGNKE